jgi:hypothetical protein
VTAGVRFPAEARDLSLLHNLKKTGPGTHPVPYAMGTGDVSLGLKCHRHEADHSPPSSAEVKNGRAIRLLTIRFHAVVVK